MRVLGCASVLLVSLYVLGILLLFAAPIAGVIVLGLAVLFSIGMTVSLVEVFVGQAIMRAPSSGTPQRRRRWLWRALVLWMAALAALLASPWWWPVLTGR